MSFRGKEIMSYATLIKCTKVLNVVFVVLIGIMMFGNVVYADAGDFGSNSYNWLKGQVFYLALLVIAAIAVPFILKKMWMQLVGFLVLAALVLVVVDDPSKLKSIGTTIWGKVFGS
jgi:cell division protein FtsW (lipid II flippase)